MEKNISFEYQLGSKEKERRDLYQWWAKRKKERKNQGVSRMIKKKERINISGEQTIASKQERKKERQKKEQWKK